MRRDEIKELLDEAKLRTSSVSPTPVQPTVTQPTVESTVETSVLETPNPIVVSPIEPTREEKQLKDKFENMKEKKMNKRELVKTILETEFPLVRDFTLTVPVEAVIERVKESTGLEIKVVEYAWSTFRNSFLPASVSSMDDATKKSIASEYYPSTISNKGVGLGISKMLVAIIPSESLKQPDNTGQYMYWGSITPTLDKLPVIANNKKLLGTRQLIAGVKKIADVEHVEIYVNTVEAVLLTLGISKDLLIEKKMKIGVAEQNDQYIIHIHK